MKGLYTRVFCSIGLLLSPVQLQAEGDGLCIDAYNALLGDGIVPGLLNDINSALALRCWDSADALRQHFSRSGTYSFDTRLLDLYLKGELQVPDVIINYATACLVSIDEVRLPNWSESLEELASRFVFVKGVSAELPICGGFRNGNLIYTARHCLRTSSFGLAAGTEIFHDGNEFCREAHEIDLSQFQFQQIEFGDEPSLHTLVVEVATGLQPSAYNGHETLVCEDVVGESAEASVNLARSDWVVLRVVDVVSDRHALQDEPLPDFVPGQLQVRFASLAYNPFEVAAAIAQHDAAEGQISIAALLASTLVFDTGLVCAMVGESDGLFFHGCQTDATSSGSPFFQHFVSTDGEHATGVSWRLIGLNLGPYVTEAMCESGYTELFSAASVENGGYQLDLD